MLRDVFLYGDLAERFTPRLQFIASSPREVLSGVQCAFPEFLPSIKDRSIRIVYGPLDNEDPIEFDVSELGTKLGKQEIHIIPIPEGAKSGAGKAILGIALLGVGLAGGFGAFGAAGFAGAAFGNTLGLSWGWLALAGGGMVLSSLAAPQMSDFGSREPVDQRPSFLYTGPVNTQMEGQPVPYIPAFDIITGGHVISLGVDVEQL